MHKLASGYKPTSPPSEGRGRTFESCRVRHPPRPRPRRSGATMSGSRDYDAEFFAADRPVVESSARRIVPLVLGMTGCRSVVDVGCGTGIWLRVFAEHGVADVLGLDGNAVDGAA